MILVRLALGNTSVRARLPNLRAKQLQLLKDNVRYGMIKCNDKATYAQPMATKANVISSLSSTATKGSLGGESEEADNEARGGKHRLSSEIL